MPPRPKRLSVWADWLFMVAMVTGILIVGTYAAILIPPLLSR